MPDADYYIDALKLSPHPEGGYYRQAYVAPEGVKQDALPARFGGDRAFSTSIYFLLNGSQVSHFHRIAADELWHFYAGSALTIHVLSEAGERQDLQLGSDITTAAFQQVVPAGCWFAASLQDTSSFALVGCTVAPGFHFDDFELATRRDLLLRYPDHAELIKKLTPEPPACNSAK